MTVLYCTAIIIAFYCFDHKFTNRYEDKEIMETIIWSSMIYLALMSEFTGDICQYLWYDQFCVEMIDQLVVSKKLATYKRLKQSFERQ